MIIVQHITEKFEDADLAGYTLPGWYFWDETESQCYGPFLSETRAKEEQVKYFEYITRSAS